MATVVAKLSPPTGGVDAVELITAGRVQLVINTPRGRGPRADGRHIREAAIQFGVPCLTTLAAGLAAAEAVTEWRADELVVRSLQEIHGGGDQLALDL